MTRPCNLVRVLAPSLAVAAALGGCTKSGPDCDAPGVACTWAGIPGVGGFGVPGKAGENGDGVFRLDTKLYFPMDVSFAPDGTAYIVDWNNHAIRRVEKDGTLTTVIGNEVEGDGSPARPTACRWATRWARRAPTSSSTTRRTSPGSPTARCSWRPGTTTRSASGIPPPGSSRSSPETTTATRRSTRRARATVAPRRTRSSTWCARSWSTPSRTSTSSTRRTSGSGSSRPAAARARSARRRQRDARLRGRRRDGPDRGVQPQQREHAVPLGRARGLGTHAVHLRRAEQPRAPHRPRQRPARLRGGQRYGRLCRRRRPGRECRASDPGRPRDRARQRLYIADRGNNAIRAVDLASGDIETVAGTGKPCPAYPKKCLEAPKACRPIRFNSGPRRASRSTRTGTCTSRTGTTIGS